MKTTRGNTHLEIEPAEFLLGVDVREPCDDHGTSGERHLGVRRLAVVRRGGSQATVVSELLVEDRGGRMARRRSLDLADVVQAQQKRQQDDAEDEDAAGATAQDLVHDSLRGAIARVRCLRAGPPR